MKAQQDFNTPFHHSWFLRICLVLYVAAAISILFLGRGSFTSFILVFMVILYLGAPLFLGSLVFWGIARDRRKDSWARYAKRGLLASLCLAALIFPTWGADRVAKHDVAQAKAFCESLLPELHDVHAKTGAYPRDISELSSYTNPPWLLRHSTIYHSNGEHFIFGINDTRAIMGGWALTSTRQNWHYFD